MTQRDDLDRLLSAWVDDPFTPPAPRYLPQVLDVTRHTRQRRAWASLERWLPMTITLRRPLLAPSVRWFAVGLALLLLSAAALAAGSFLQRSDQRSAVLDTGHPDGLVAYETNGDIWTWDPATGERALLVEDGAAPLWSPDGSKLLFWRTVGVRDTPMVLTPGAGDPVALVEPGLFSVGGAAWSPDNTLVAVVSDQGGSPQLTLFHADGSGTVMGPGMPQTTMDAMAFLPPPDPETAGSWELLVREHAADGATTLDRYTGQAGGPRVSTGGPFLAADQVDPSAGALSTGYFGTYDLLDPTVPDGQLVPVAYTQLHDLGTAAPDGNGFRVHVFDGQTDHAVVLRRDADDEAWPVWDPRGERIAFQSYESDEGGSRITIAEPTCCEVSACPDGCKVPLMTDVIPATDPNSLGYAWSPDGTRLLVQDARTGRVWMVDSTQVPGGGGSGGNRDGLLPTAPIALTELDWTSQSTPSWRP